MKVIVLLIIGEILFIWIIYQDKILDLKIDVMNEEGVVNKKKKKK